MIAEKYIEILWQKGSKMIKSKSYSEKNKIKNMTFIGLFCAMAFLCVVLLNFKVSFLTFDLKDAVMAICGMFFGPLAGLFTAVVVPLLEFVSISGTGVYGLIMNTLASVTFVGTASLIYRIKRNLSGAILGLATAVLATTAVMLVANLIVTPFYINVPTRDVASMIPTLLLPFNLVKSLLNAAIVMLLYKPLSNVIKRFGVSSVAQTNGGTKKDISPYATKKRNMRSVCVAIVAAVIVIGALVIVFAVLGGDISFFNF